MNFAAVLDRNVEITPDRPAIIYGDHHATYADVGDEVSRLANALRDLDVEVGDRVAMMISPRPELPLTFFAVIKAGAVVVPVNVLYQPEEIAFLLNDSGAEVLITNDDLLPRVEQALPEATRVRHVLSIGGGTGSGDGRILDYANVLIGSSPDFPTVPREDNDLAAFAYSSGTTGFPKGAMHTHYNLRRHGEMLIERYSLSSEDSILSVLPIFLLPSFMTGPALALQLGATSVIRPKFDPEDFVATVERHGITFCICTPTMYHMLVNLPEDVVGDLSSFRYAMFGGSPMPPELRRRFEDRFGIETYHCYGLSETVAVAVSDPVEGERKFESVGVAMPGIALRIEGDDGDELPPGEVGEICVGPDGSGRYTTMQGYWGRPDLSEQALRAGFVRTGDVGYLDEDGFLFLVDRKKDVIFAGGWTIFPVELEEVILQHPGVEHAAVVGMEDDRLGEVPVAFVVPTGAVRLTPAVITTFCRDRMAAYKVPRRVHVVDELPRNALGKILKRELEEPSDGAAEVAS